MVLPLGDTPNPRGVPLVTYLLLAVNIAAFVVITLPLSQTPVDPSDPLLPEYERIVRHSLERPLPSRAILSQTSAYHLFVFRHGFRPAAPSVADLFWSLFLHAGFLHLFGNMLFLWIYGDNVEHRLGGLGYLVAYLASGVAATLFHAAFDTGSPLPLIGASGAISGVLGFYFLWFPHNQVRLLVVLFPFFMDVFLVSARFVLGMYLILDNLLPFLVSRGVEGGGVAHGAHIGGFIAGLVAAWWLDRRQLATAPREFRGGHARARDVGTPSAALQGLIADGRFDAAARLYFSLDGHASRGALRPSDALALAEWLRQRGHTEAALTVYRRHLRDYPHGAGAAAAHLGAGLIQLEDLGQAAPAYQHFLDALDLDPPSEIAEQARSALRRIAALQKFQVGHPHASRTGR